jgi:hypothetical protein
VESGGDIFPILTTASRAERATMRAAREMARRQAVDSGRVAHIELKDDGLATTQAELERLTTCHRSEHQKIDWRPMMARQPMPLPVRGNERERAARQALTSWQPGWQDRMFGDEAQRRHELSARIAAAQREDELAFQQAYRAAETFNAEALIARKLVELDPKAIKDAVALKTRLFELREGVNSIAIGMPGNGRLVALVDAIQEGDVPYERITEGDARSARRELIPLAERRQLHLAALCAAGLRIGAELVSVLPVEAIEVAVGCEMPDPNGGRPTPQPVMQLLMTAKALSELKWMKEDAITLATSLGARMDWAIERGFTPIRVVPMSAMGKPLAQPA